MLWFQDLRKKKGGGGELCIYIHSVIVQINALKRGLKCTSEFTK